jgi:ribose transport system ATP-binding protein
MLQLRNISKTFGVVRALQDVTIEFCAGEIHALCGENGAGKSTLMAVVAGNLQPDSGEIIWNGGPVVFQNRMQSQALGIGIVYQERSLVESLSIAENIYPVNQPKTRWGGIDYTALHAQAQQLLYTLQLNNLSSRTIVARLSPAQKSMVEIAKALAQHPKLLILDEPTASLTHHETGTLFQILMQLKAQGVAIIYITHRMAEVEQLADVVSVLKDGQYQGTLKKSETTPEQIVRLMVGRELEQWHKTSSVQNDVLLDVQQLSGTGFSDVSFSIRRGEVFGLAGLPGSGRTELARALFGDSKISRGQLFKTTIPLTLRHPADAIKAGLAYLPDDRKAYGLFLDSTVAENIAATDLQEGWYNAQQAERDAATLCRQLDIRTPSVKQQVRKLSGGNQQKIVLAKWLHRGPEILIVNEPTHGVDVGAKREIYELLKKFTAQGKSVLLISSDLPELLLLSDRIGVMYRGHLRTILERTEATEERITAIASGI